MTKTVPTAERGTGVAGFKKKAKGVTPPSKPGRHGVFLTDIIVELGFADQEQVDAVVEAARSSSKTVEELLLERDAVDENELSLAIAERNGLDHVDLKQFEVDTSATAKITPSMGLRHSAVPIAFADDGALIVAVADPFDTMTISDIEETTKSEVRLAIATPMAIHQLLEGLLDESPEPEGPTPPEVDSGVDSKPKLKVLRREAPRDDEPEEDVVEPDPPPQAETRREKRKPEAPAASAGDEDFERAVRRAQRVEGELIVARRQVADLKQHIAKNGSPSPELERKVAQLGRRTGELEQRIAELEAQKGELEAQNGLFQRQNAQLKLKVTELVQWAGEVVSVAEEATKMTAKLDALRQVIDENPA